MNIHMCLDEHIKSLGITFIKINCGSDINKNMLHIVIDIVCLLFHLKSLKRLENWIYRLVTKYKHVEEKFYWLANTIDIVSKI